VLGYRYDAFSLQARWLQPRGGRGNRGAPARGGGNRAAQSDRAAIKVTVTPKGGESVTGTLLQVDDFSVSLRDTSGEYRSFLREDDSLKVEVQDPLRHHSELLRIYHDADIHNVTAYLASLK